LEEALPLGFSPDRVLEVITQPVTGRSWVAGVYEENAGLSTCGPRRRNAAKPRARLSGEGRNPEKRRLDPGLRRDDGAAIEPLTGHTYPVKPAL